MSRQLHDSSSHTATAGATQPRYRRLARTLAGEIRRDYRPGDLLPPEKALAERFDSRNEGRFSRRLANRLRYGFGRHEVARD